MRKKIQNIPLFLLTFSVLYTASSFAQIPMQEESTDNFKVKGVCVFDIDETIVFTVTPPGSTKTEYVQTPQAQAVIDLCISQGYGVALATKKYKYRSMKELADLDFGKYNQYLSKENALYENYTDVRNPDVNPIYIYQTHGDDRTLERRIANKSQALDRIMRTYYGMGVGGSFLNKNNSYLKQYMEIHDNELPSDKNLTGCIVLFDDDQNNIDDIKAYNMVYGTNFGAVKVQYDKENKEGTGVLIDNAKEAFDYMGQHCKS